MSVSDETMAAWVREQNRGAPAWEDLDNSARAWWRDRYTIRHAGQTQDRGRADADESTRLRAALEALYDEGERSGWGLVNTYRLRALLDDVDPVDAA